MLQIFFRKVATLALHFGVSILSWLRCIVAMVLRCFCHGFFIGLLKKHFRFVLIWVTQYQLIWVTRFQLIRVTLCYVSLSWRFLCLGVSIFCMFFSQMLYRQRPIGFYFEFSSRFVNPYQVSIRSGVRLGSGRFVIGWFASRMYRAMHVGGVKVYTKSGREDTISEKE